VLQAAGAPAVNSRLNLLDICLYQGDLDAAADWAEQILRDLGPSLAEGGALRIEAGLSSAQVACARGDYPVALSRLAELEASLALNRHRGYLAQSYLVRGTVHRQLAEYAAAEQTALAALQIAVEMGERRSEIAALLLLGDVARLTGRPEVGVRYHERGRRRAEEANLRHPLAQSLASLAEALCDSGDLPGALAAAGRAEQIAADCGFQPILRQARRVLEAAAGAR
jgi:tetratricopeptide (TPR) repeat protein